MLVLSGTLLLTGQQAADYHGNCSVTDNVPAFRYLSESSRMQVTQQQTSNRVTVSDYPGVCWLHEHCQDMRHFTMQLHLTCGGMS